MSFQIDTQALKRTYPISEVAAGYGIDLRPSGRALVGRCPFHDDGGRPNLHVYESSSSWYCYRCAIGGDVISFVERMEHVGFREAVERIAGGLRASITGSRGEGSGAHERAAKRATPLGPDERACLAAATELYQNRFLTDSEALAYCQSRGLDRETLERHRVGYSTGDELADYLRWRRLPLQAAVRVGLLRRDNRDFLTGRIVLPEIRRGQPIWLIGRSLSPHSSEPKYLGLPGRKPLLGWESARGSSEVYLVEGVFDLLTLWSWSLPAVALVGTHVRAAVLDVFARFERIYLVLDNDWAGREASARLEKAIGQRAKVVRLPGVKDVAELAPRPDGRSIFARALVESERADRPQQPTSLSAQDEAEQSRPLEVIR
ncbi:MAG: toprim domain-containing protein [Nitrososphaerota archaeon]|nr:toprim domain-containing protein [Nitrososphaerota archaeon]